MPRDFNDLGWISRWTPLIGEPKFLSQPERERFLEQVTALPNPKDRTYCETLYWTGCRPSEGLATSAFHVAVKEGAMLFCTLKKRGTRKGRVYRVVPVPTDFTARLDIIHHIREAQAQPDEGRGMLLWEMSRTTAWKRVGTVMKAAEISGIRACAKGLRHGYSVRARGLEIPDDRLQAWLGHDKPSTTVIYLDVMGQPEDRAFAERMWV